MSHYTELKVKFEVKNEGQLLAALKEIFGEDGVSVHEKAVNLKMFNGSTWDMYKNQETEKCHIVVSQEAQKKLTPYALTNDIGFKRNKNGTYEVFADRAGFSEKLEKQLLQNYTTRVTEKVLKLQGYCIKRVPQKNGSVQLIASKYS